MELKRRSFFSYLLFLCSVISFVTISCAPASEIAPQVIIITPPSNVYAAGDLTVSVNTNNFSIIDKQGQPPVPGEGHFHYFFDVPAPTSLGKPALTTAGTYGSTASNTFTWHNVGSGNHTISVELVNNDHTPLNPAVIATKSVLVVPEIGIPNTIIISPREGASLAPGNVTISAEVDNFLLVDTADPTVSASQGHIIYYMDVNAPTNPGEPAVTANGTFIPSTDTSNTWQNIAKGSHTFSIELVNDDNTPLTPAVVATIKINIG